MGGCEGRGARATNEQVTRAGATGHLLVSAPPGTRRVLHGSGPSLSFSETNERLIPLVPQGQERSFGLCFPIPVAK